MKASREEDLKALLDGLMDAAMGGKYEVVLGYARQIRRVTLQDLIDMGGNQEERRKNQEELRELKDKDE